MLFGLLFSRFKRISPKEVKQMLDEGQNFSLVDVRTPQEYTQGHIPSSINLPSESIYVLGPRFLKKRTDIIVLYCQRGNRAAAAAKVLEGLGYSNVYVMGGIINWPYEIEYYTDINY